MTSLLTGQASGGVSVKKASNRIKVELLCAEVMCRGKTLCVFCY